MARQGNSQLNARPAAPDARACAACHAQQVQLFKGPLPAGLRASRQSLQDAIARSTLLKARITALLHAQWPAHASIKDAFAAELSLYHTTQRVNDLVATNDALQAHLNAVRARVARRRQDLAFLGSLVKRMQRVREGSELERVQNVRASKIAQRVLCARQAVHMQTLQQLLPLQHCRRGDGDGGESAEVSIASLPVVDLPDQLPDVMRRSYMDTCAACGYLILYVGVLATIMGAPLLHVGGYLGHESAVWQPSTFWDRRREASCSMCLSTDVDEHSFSALYMVGGSAIASWVQSADPDEQSRQNTDIRTGYKLLQRSVACAAQHFMAMYERALPTSHSPFYWLLLVNEFMRQRGGEALGGSPVAPALSASPVPGAWTPAVRLPRHGQHHGEDAHPCFIERQEDYTEWNMVQLPGEVLPPPPSEVANTEHWERAMFTDKQQRASQAGRSVFAAAIITPWVLGRRASGTGSPG